MITNHPVSTGTEGAVSEPAALKLAQWGLLLVAGLAVVLGAARFFGIPA